MRLDRIANITSIFMKHQLFIHAHLILSNKNEKFYQLGRWSLNLNIE